jgi:hypothetical protein
MISFLPSREEHTIAVEFKGKSTSEDIENLDHYVNKHFTSKEKLICSLLLRILREQHSKDC